MATGSQHNQRLGFIGTGAIAEAVIVGLIEHAVFKDPVLISKRNKARSTALEKRYQNVSVECDNQAIVDASDWLFVSVLPSQAREVLMQLRFRKPQSLISLVAGIKIDELRQIASPIQNIHRIIPLPPIERGIGPIPLCPPDPEIRALFDRCGQVIETDDEDEFSVFSAASGLMATHHELTATIARWIENQGVSTQNAAQYASSIFAALGNIESGTAPEELCKLADRSTTVGGLNEQVLRELREAHWFDQIHHCLDRLYERLSAGM